jgi:hypothetical protein
LHLFHVLKKNPKMDIVTSLWLSIRIWPTCQKSFFSIFFRSRCRL